MLTENHANDIQHPNDGKSENQAENTSNNIAVSKSSNRAEQPRRKRNNCQNHTNNIGGAEIIATRLFSHKVTS